MCLQMSKCTNHADKYFRHGACFKGDECKFLHTDKAMRNQSYLPAQCNRGPECIFYMQNRCKFSHQTISFKNTHRGRAQYNKKQCRYKGDCWSKRCPYNHPDQVFQLGNRTNKPPIRSAMMDVWMDY